MAAADLIVAYAADLSRRLGGRAGAVVAEVRGHLAEAVECRVARGASPETAVREAIAAFGAPGEVARSFRERGISLPTRRSGRAGWWLIISAALVVISLATLFAAQVAEWRHGWYETPQVLGSFGSLALVLALAAWAVGMRGLARRAGPSSTVATGGSLVVGVGAIVALPSWFLWGWVTALAIGVGLTLPQVHRARLAPRWSIVVATLGALGAAGSAWLPLALGWSATAVLSAGSVRLGVAIGVAAMAMGACRVGFSMVRDAAPTGLITT